MSRFRIATFNLENLDDSSGRESDLPALLADISYAASDRAAAETMR